MSRDDKKRYYWLKLKKDFFKRSDIKLIESMTNGKEYILFYLKLLCESVEDDGILRFNETIPYDINMLSVVTDTNVDIVRSAMELFQKLGMVALIDNDTYYIKEVEKLVGHESHQTKRKRENREAKELDQAKSQVLPMSKDDLEDEPW